MVGVSEKTQTDVGKSILLSDEVRIISGSPEWETITRLDSLKITDVWTSQAAFDLACHFRSDAKPPKATFGKLRTLTDKQVKGLKLPKSLHTMISLRLSSRILCDCGMPFILHRDHVACERPGCIAFHHLPSLAALRKAFPDQISHTRGE